MPCLVCPVWGKGAWYVQLGERVPGMCSWEKGCLVCAVGGKGGAWYVQLGERVPGMCSWEKGCLVCAVGGKGAWYVQLGERVPYLVCAVGEMGYLYFLLIVS